MRIFLVMLLSFFTLSGAVLAKELPLLGGRIAVAPYIDTSAFDKGYVKSTVKDGYTRYFEKAGMETVPEKETARALSAYGYDPGDLMLPEREVMDSVARATGADYVVAMEVESIDSAKHEAVFQFKITANVKLKYHFYSAKTRKFTAFQVTGVNHNKTMIGRNVSTKTPVVKALKEAMEKADAKILDAMEKNAAGRDASFSRFGTNPQRGGGIDDHPDR